MDSLDTIKHALQHPDWNVRNNAIKKCGAIKSPESVEVIKAILSDHRPSVWWRSLMGDPYYQVGFIRRNAWSALKDQDLSDFPLDQMALKALQDPYYEVRAECLNIISNEVSSTDYYPEITLKNSIRQAFWKERNIDICLALFPLAKYVLDNDEILILAHKVLNYKHWRIRSAFLNCLIELAEEDEKYNQKILDIIKRSNMMSEYFRPIFELKLKQSELVELINKAS